MSEEYVKCLEVGPRCAVEDSIYGYTPNRAVNGLLCVLFGICCLIQLFQAWKYKTWTYGGAMVLGCLSECIGYVGRLLLYDNPFSSIGFQIQICLLIIAPAFLSAAIYLTLKHLCLALEPSLSLLQPKWYTWIFIIADISSLTLQGIGGGVAATAEDDMDQQDMGANIMIAGIIWQVVTLTVFGSFVAHFFWRWNAEKHRITNMSAQKLWANRRFKIFLGSTTLAFVCIYARCIYRIAEMVGGWKNEIMQDQISFVVLEGFMCLIAVILLTTFHGGDCFPHMRGNYVDEKSSSLPLNNMDGNYADLHDQPLMNQRPQWGTNN